MGAYEAIKLDHDYDDYHPQFRDDDYGGGDIELALQSKSKSTANVLQNSSTNPNKQRLVSLDVFRGLTVAIQKQLMGSQWIMVMLFVSATIMHASIVTINIAYAFASVFQIFPFSNYYTRLMILVDDVGGIVPAINHSPWNGLTLADFVMPFFLFIVGLSLALTYKKLSNKAVATKNATLRAMKLLLLGLFLQGGFFHGIHNLTYGVDIERMRLMGILQRIAIAYLVAAVCEIWLKGDHDHHDDDDVKSGLSLLKKYRFQWTLALVLVTIYLSLLYGLYVPDWEFQIPSSGTSSSTLEIFKVKCGVRGDTGPACNAIGMIDRKILGIQHIYNRPIYSRTKECSINSPDYGPLPPNAPSWCRAPFDPEGLLSSVMAIVTCLLGLHYGHIIIYFKDHKNRILRWTMASVILLVGGLALDLFGMHLNKVLFTLSYMCVTAGAAGIVFVGIYLMVDVYGYRRMTLVIEWIGRHALTIYILVACNVLPLLLQGFYWRRPQNNILRLIGIGA